MPLNREVIDHIAHLARLGVSNAAEGDSIQNDLNRIVAMVDKISQANTDGITPVAHSLEIPQRLRPDVVSEPNQRDGLLALASPAEAEIGLFLVPQVIE